VSDGYPRATKQQGDYPSEKAVVPCPSPESDMFGAFVCPFFFLSFTASVTLLFFFYRTPAPFWQLCFSPPSGTLFSVVALALGTRITVLPFLLVFSPSTGNIQFLYFAREVVRSFFWSSRLQTPKRFPS